ncbi:major facilitator superfamily domain-containing protein [Xylaria arbuscula]|nr:major facilitator superfamily domain-containing protein [Xylaria arbuscula]
MKVIGLFFVYLITWGQLSSFSTYQDYYEETMLSTYSPSTISWVGTTQNFLVGMIGLLSGAMYDRGYIQQALIPGIIFLVLSSLLLSFSQQYWHVFLSQGLLFGIGGGFIYVPAVSIVADHFESQAPLALGIGATGSAVGGVVLPLAFRSLLASIGFGWTNRVFALIIFTLAIGSYCTLMIHTESKKLPFASFFSRHPELGDCDEGSIAFPMNKYLNTFRNTLKGPAYQLLCVGMFFVLLGYWIPVFYLVPYASRSLNIPPTYSSGLLSIFNGASLFGRIVPAALGHKIGVVNVLLAGATILGVLNLTWISVESIAGITAWSIFLGFTGGSVITIPNAAVSSISSPSSTGQRIGIMWAAAAVAELIGTPIAGALLTRRDGQVSYLGCQAFAGISVLIGAVFLAFSAWRAHKDGTPKEQSSESSL